MALSVLLDENISESKSKFAQFDIFTHTWNNVNTAVKHSTEIERRIARSN